jgi:hypothetical protein
MKKYSIQDQRLMAAWAADCAERVLPFFEEVYPDDDRPRTAIEACRTWVRTGVFRMQEIRGASLAAHAAARMAGDTTAACYAARAAGHAVATAHVPQHAFGSALYALKAIAAAHPASAEADVDSERTWQSARLPDHLRQEIMERIHVLNRRGTICISLQKGEGY